MRFSISLLAALMAALPTFAHADEDGKRTFTTTLQFEDADVEDDLVTPIRVFKENDDGNVGWSTTYASELTKRITEDFALSVEGAYVYQNGDLGGEHGFGGAGLGFKYSLYENDDTESKITLGGDWDIGGTASHNISPESYSTLSPQLYFAQGLGGIQNRPDWLAPAAVSGIVGLEIPTRRFDDEFDVATGSTVRERNQTAAQYGFALQYDLAYMNKYTHYNVPAFFNHLTPIVEFIFETPLNGDDHGTTGTINPGVAWRSDAGIELAAEAIIPINDRTGHSVGAIAQLRIPLDQFSESLAEPIF